MVNTWTFTLTGQDIIQAGDLITGGKSFMKYIANRYETQLRQLVTDKGDTLVTEDSKKYYPVFRWEGDELVIDNSATFLDQSGDRKRPQLLFGKKLVEVVNWIGTDMYGTYLTNGNLRSEADSVPDDIEKDWTYKDDYRSWTELWTYLNEGLQLSAYCNWRFVYLDGAYQKAFGGSLSNTITPRTPMYLYSNVGRSMITGKRLTDLL